MTSPGQGSGSIFINPFKNLHTSIRKFAQSKQSVMVIDIDYKCFYFDDQKGQLDEIKKIIYAPSSTLHLGKIGIFQDVSVGGKFIYGASHMEEVIKKEIQAVLYTAANPKRKATDHTKEPGNANPNARAKTSHHENPQHPEIDDDLLNAFRNPNALAQKFSAAALRSAVDALPVSPASSPAASPAQAAALPAVPAWLFPLPPTATQEEVRHRIAELNAAAHTEGPYKLLAANLLAPFKAAAEQAARIASAKAAADQAAAIAANQAALVASAPPPPAPAPLAPLAPPPVDAAANNFNVLMNFVTYVKQGVSDILTLNNPSLTLLAREALKSISSEMSPRV